VTAGIASQLADRPAAKLPTPFSAAAMWSALRLHQRLLATDNSGRIY